MNKINKTELENETNPRKPGLLTNLFDLFSITLDSPEKWFILGFENQARGHYMDAEKCYTKVLEMDQKCAEVWNNLGCMCYQKALKKIAIIEDATVECRDALDCFKKALEINQFDGAIWNNMRIVYYYGMRKFKSAEICYKKIRSYEPDLTNSYNMDYKMRFLKIYPEYLTEEKKPAQAPKPKLKVVKSSEKIIKPSQSNELHDALDNILSEASDNFPHQKEKSEILSNIIPTNIEKPPGIKKPSGIKKSIGIKKPSGIKKPTGVKKTSKIKKTSKKMKKSKITFDSLDDFLSS
ncbi:MAG: hypothetical protein GY870_10510 [archaeon]|nr:hypothetical protein [archaeon]